MVYICWHNDFHITNYFFLISILFSAGTSQQQSESTFSSHQNINATSSVGTNDQEIVSLRDQGYVVQEFADRSSVVLFGDVAYDPRQLHSPTPAGRWSTFRRFNTWLELEKPHKPHLRYYFDTETSPDKTMFMEAANSWMDKTCIQFEKMPDAPCSENTTVASICVGKFPGCWSYHGRINPYGGESQKFTIGEGCQVHRITHEFGHLIGFQHVHGRPDRDQFITVNNEFYRLVPSKKNNAKLINKWGQLGRCSEDQMNNWPIPYDYRSIMHYATNEYGDDDYLPVIVTKDVRHQYMLNYKYYANQLETHYDFYTLNRGYKCEEMWAEECTKNGKNIPKCQNLGYMGKNCECICPPQYEGATCEKKNGPMFPVMPKAKVLKEVRGNQVVDLTRETMSTDNLDGIKDKFEYYQFVTVVIDHPDNTTQALVTVLQTVSKSKLLMGQFKTKINGDFPEQDCQLFFMWGQSHLGQMRTECFSSVANNEPEGPMFISKTNHMDISAQSRFGELYTSAQLSIEVLKLKLAVKFVPSVVETLVVIAPNVTTTTHHPMFAPDTPPPPSGPPARVIIGFVMLGVTPIALIALGIYYREKVRELFEKGVEKLKPENGDNNSDSDSSGDDDDDDETKEKEKKDEKKEEKEDKKNDEKTENGKNEETGEDDKKEKEKSGWALW